MSNPTPRHIEFLKVLGRGAFGEVHLVKLDSGDGFVQHLAAKLLKPDMASRIDVVKRQRDEAKLLAHLHHHNIVRVFDLLEIHGRPTVLMEYVSGVDTQVLLNQVGRFPTRAAIQVVAAVASALDAAYNAPNPNTGTPLHVVHRDIKPANVLISGHGGVKILDFGVARGEFEREGQTMDTVLGTAAFIAPEQWLHCETSHATDIYALGVTLLALLGLVHDQRAPLDVGSHKALVQTRLKALGAQESEPEIREVLTSLISKMLAFDPTVRPAARDVEETCLSLMDRPTGGGLVTFARTQVPPLILEREKRFATDSLLPSFKYSQGNIDISGPLADEFGSVPEQTFEWNSLGPEDSHEPKNDRESDQRHAMSPKGEHDLDAPAISQHIEPAAEPHRRDSRRSIDTDAMHPIDKIAENDASVLADTDVILGSPTDRASIDTTQPPDNFNTPRPPTNNKELAENVDFIDTTVLYGNPHEQQATPTHEQNSPKFRDTTLLFGLKDTQESPLPSKPPLGRRTIAMIGIPITTIGFFTVGFLLQTMDGPESQGPENTLVAEQTMPATAEPVCGNDKTEAGEQCDDDNRIHSDREVLAVRGSVQAKLQMSDEAAAGLEVFVMPNAKMLAGAKDPATGLCLALGKEQGTWDVVSMGTSIDVTMIMGMGTEYGDGTFGSTVDVDELDRWTKKNCGAAEPPGAENHALEQEAADQ